MSQVTSHGLLAAERRALEQRGLEGIDDRFGRR
jgi:hypothetical protein